MKLKRKIFFLSLGLMICLLYTRADGQIRAFSMKMAKQNINSGDNSAAVFGLGGITALAGMIYDSEQRDLIIVGKSNKSLPQITLDDLVVAWRSWLVYEDPPLVSIDRTPDSKKTGKQTVVFKGKIENTQFGMDLLNADVTLKKFALNKLPLNVWGINSYFSRFKNKSLQDTTENVTGSRFWFKIKEKPAFAAPPRSGIIFIREMKIEIKTEVLYALRNGKQTQNLEGFRDELGDQFANELTNKFYELSTIYKNIGRVKTLLDLVALAKGIENLPSVINLNFWLKKYRVNKISTPKTYDLLRQKVTEKDSRGRAKIIELNGGIELEIDELLMIRLNSGDVTALKDVVLKSRPDQQSLFWDVPVDSWEIPDALVTPEPVETSKSNKKYKKEGCFIEAIVRNVNSKEWNYDKPLPPPNTEFPDFAIYEKLYPQTELPDVGGVMLHAVAKIPGSTNANVNLADGSFSFVVGGRNARIDPKTFRNFVTALWSVYYDTASPGISIDPIPGVDKHLVLYIGNVINNDLGRVMREADYTMKKWAVGTESPNIPGFKSPAEFAAQRGIIHVGAFSRFWFVPEEMRFKQSDNLLIFDGGRMTLKTEYAFAGGRGQSSPENEEFAQFFTENYHKIADKYPIYQELFEYAKLVSLAQYLKQSGVPLFWFLMANKDLIITEDSPGTVNELVKGLSEFPGIQIIGGVNLASKQGQYVYDRQAVTAINEALSQLPASAYAKTSLSGEEKTIQSISESFSFDLKDKSYTVLPQHSLTSGKDRRGIRYQTDLALRQNGEPGLELVRYFNPNKRDEGEFGKGWHLLIPYRIKPAGKDKIRYANVILPKRMAVENLLSGEEEILEFSKDRYSIAGYVPDSLKSSQVLGLFLMADASYRLADKIGNEFHFDRAGYLTEMVLGKVYQIQYEYNDGFINDFEEDPYQLQEVDEERTKYGVLILPKRLAIKTMSSGSSELFEFRSKWGVGAYIPKSNLKGKFRKIIMMTNRSFRLIDRKGNEIAFDPSGLFDGIAPNREAFRVISSITQGSQKITFKYTIDEKNSVRIAESYLLNTEEEPNPMLLASYIYDSEGRLAKVDRERNLFAQN